MTKSEQSKLVRALKDYTNRMNQDDRRDFEMIAKRDHDDEDLDSIAVRRLEELHEKYVPRKSKADIETLFKKHFPEPPDHSTNG